MSVVATIMAIMLAGLPREVECDSYSFEVFRILAPVNEGIPLSPENRANLAALREAQKLRGCK